jgi:leucyl-tRNA synthetase
MGSAQQKAQIVREIIQNYGVDIETLDKVLAGAPINPQSATVNAQNTPPAWAAPLFQFVNGVQQTQKQREQQINQEAEQQTQAFAASHEFYEDVREDMADFMEFAAKRGRAMTLQQAYDRACQENSDVKAILDQREAAKRSSAPGGVARARAAASTVVGQPRNSPVPAAPADRRGDIMAAWEAQESR